MSQEWYYTTGGQQAGPVSWDDLAALAAQRKVTPADHVWNASMSGWVAASSIPGLIPAPKVPPLPPPLPPAVPGTALVAKTRKVSGEIVLAGAGGAVLPGQMNKMEVKLDGKSLGSGSLVGGVRLPFEATVGHHTVEVSMSGGLAKLFGGFGKMMESSASARTYPVEFPTAGHYLVTLTPAKIRGCPPDGVQISLTDEAPQQLALAPVAEEVPEEGLVQRGFAAIGRGVKGMQESSRRSQLHGRWEPVNGVGQWFLFTRDGGMIRSDGFAAKFRWAGDEVVELYESGSDVVIPLQLLSLGKQEIIVKVGGQSGHFRRTQTITEAVEQQQREEAERRFAEWRDKTAQVLAIGGLAVLIGTVAVAATAVAASAPRHCTCMFPLGGPVCVRCGLLR